MSGATDANGCRTAGDDACRNSLGVQIASALSEGARLHEGAEVDVTIVRASW